jgi:hypothetical protein
MLPGSILNTNLPKEISSLTITFHRLLPSFGTLLFTFNIEQSFSDNLKNIQNQAYLQPISFNSLFSYKSIFHKTKFDISNKEHFKKINKSKDLLRGNLEKWLKCTFHWKKQLIGKCFYTDFYKISGNPINEEQLNQWIKENKMWLADYGVFHRPENTYQGNYFMLSDLRNSIELVKCSVIAIQLDNEADEGNGYQFDEKINSIAVCYAITYLIEQYRSKVELLRGKSFRKLRANKLNNSQLLNIQEIKKTVVLLNRLKSELNGSQYWLEHYTQNIETLTDIGEQKVNFHDITILRATNQLDRVIQAAKIIDSGLTSYLSMQSIFSMYRLQRSMYVLSIVVVVLTLISLFSSEEFIKGYLTTLITNLGFT